jgi:hypothetical protein
MMDLLDFSVGTGSIDGPTYPRPLLSPDLRSARSRLTRNTERRGTIDALVTANLHFGKKESKASRVPVPLGASIEMEPSGATAARDRSGFRSHNVVTPRGPPLILGLALLGRHDRLTPTVSELPRVLERNLPPTHTTAPGGAAQMGPSTRSV